MERYFLGIDIGTFESRGILIDESFRVVADASVPHGMDNPQPGWFEQDAEAVWWGDLCKLCRTLIKQSEIRPEQIACVGTSALGTDCLPVDEQCRPLRPAILYGIDARASEEAAWLTEHYGQARVQQMLIGGIAYGFQRSAVDLRPSMRSFQSEEHSGGLCVLQGASLTVDIRQHDQSVTARRHSSRLPRHDCVGVFAALLFGV